MVELHWLIDLIEIMQIKLYIYFGTSMEYNKQCQ